DRGALLVVEPELRAFGLLRQLAGLNRLVAADIVLRQRRRGEQRQRGRAGQKKGSHGLVLQYSSEQPETGRRGSLGRASGGKSFNRTVDTFVEIWIIVLSCSSRGVTGDVPRTEQRWDGRPEMRSCRLIGSDRKVRLMRRPRAGLVTPAPGRPWPAVRRHYDRLPAVLRNDGLHAAATKERWPPLRIGGLNTGPVAARKYGPKGLQERRINSPDCASLSGCGAPGGASSRSQGMRRRLTASRAASPAARGASQAPAFPGAPLPLGSGGLQFARGPPRGRPKSTGDESCVWVLERQHTKMAGQRPGHCLNLQIRPQGSNRLALAFH